MSNAVLIRRAPAEVLLAVLKAQSSLTPSGDESGSAAPDRGLQGHLQELGLSQLALPLIKAMGPHNLEDQMQYTKLNTRAVDSLDVRGIP